MVTKAKSDSTKDPVQHGANKVKGERTYPEFFLTLHLYSTRLHMNAKISQTKGFLLLSPEGLAFILSYSLTSASIQQ